MKCAFCGVKGAERGGYERFIRPLGEKGWICKGCKQQEAALRDKEFAAASTARQGMRKTVILGRSAVDRYKGQD